MDSSAASNPSRPLAFYSFVCPIITLRKLLSLRALLVLAGGPGLEHHGVAGFAIALLLHAPGFLGPS